MAKRRPKQGKVRLTKSQEREKRSKAAIKGWRTRRRNELRAQVEKLDSKIGTGKRQTREVLSRLPPKKRKKAEKEVAAKPKKPRKKLSASATKKELLERINQLEKENQETRAEVELARLRVTYLTDWVHIPGWTREDGTTALNYSSLRERPEANELWRKLDAANLEGMLDYEAEQMAVFYDVPVREVYTLFYSR